MYPVELVDRLVKCKIFCNNGLQVHPDVGSNDYTNAMQSNNPQNTTK